MSLLNKIDFSNLPKHIAIIMDGNGRWAKKRGLPRIIGHRAGVNSVRNIVETCTKLKIKILTLYVFSTENWARPEAEVKSLMNLFERFLKKELSNLQKNNIKLTTIGDATRLTKSVYNELNKTKELTNNNSGLILNLAINYGSRQEIVTAVNNILSEGHKEVTETNFSNYLYTKDLSEPDLLIRTSGEQRISNFLLWQLAYSELYFTPVLWPDFRAKHLYEAIIDYQSRQRRYGKLA